MRRHSIELICFLLLLTGCSVKPQPLQTRSAQTLSRTLLSLDRSISPREAQKLSKDLFVYTALLTKEFKLTSPPLWHNFLVNVGIKKKGLCYDFSDALYRHLRSRAYPHFRFHLVVSDKGAYFKEHNALLITAKDQSIQKGIIIDAWRHSGKLCFKRLREDRAYRWIHRDDRCLCQNGR